MIVPFVDLKREYSEISLEINQAFDRVVKSGRFVLGSEVKSFEKKLAAFCQVKHAVGVGSGSEALVIALKSLGIGPGDEVITVANTFSATVSSIIHVGAKPVLVDVNSRNYLIDPQSLKLKINSQTKAIIIVHLYGQPVVMEPILKIAQKHCLKVIEDAAQAIGSTYKGKKAGSFGDVAIFSFYPTKNLGAYGEAGALVTSQEKIAKKAKALRDQGEVGKSEHQLVGYNSRVDALQAAFLKTKLKKLNSWNKKRRLHAERYFENLKKLPLVLPFQNPKTKTNWHLFVIRLKNRDLIKNKLMEKGIFCGIHYPKPIHFLPAYHFLGYRKGSFPESEKACREVLSLPMFPQLRRGEIDHVCLHLKKIIR